MKTLYNKLVLVCAVLLAFASCKKDEEMVKVTGGTTPTLSTTVTSVVLNQDNAAQNAITVSWTPYSITWSNDAYKSDIVKYTLEVDKKGNNFASAVTTDLTGASKVFTVSALNTVLTKLELSPGAASDVDLRLKVVTGSNVDPIYSNVISIKATPYLDIPEYPSLYVVGGFQGWSPGTAPKVSSPKSNTEYEGYVNFPDASEFKFTSAPDWNHTNYGAAATAGELSTDGGAGNLKATAAGYYLLKVDIGTLKWSATKTTWGVIGSATGSWDVDKPLTYDATAKVWKATITLSAGEIKFRANGSWDINYGAGSAEGLLKLGAGNIAITDAGSYEVTLNLSNPGYYLYKLKKI